MEGFLYFYSKNILPEGDFALGLSLFPCWGQVSGREKIVYTIFLLNPIPPNVSWVPSFRLAHPAGT